jgi:acyl-CoA thioesterase
VPVLSDGGPAVRVPVEFDPRWAVCSVFGGAVAAAVVSAARAALGTALPLSELLISFLAPTPSGSAVVVVRRARGGGRFAHADVAVWAGGVITATGVVTFATGIRSGADGLDPVGDPPRVGAPTFDGALEWAPVGGGGGMYRSWVRATPGSSSVVARGADEWLCLVSDIAAPAVATAARAAVGGSFVVATATLALSIRAEVRDVGGWVRQDVSAGIDGRSVAAETVLRDADGAVLARASQRAVVSPTDERDPRLVTGFANSDIHSHLFGIN